ncbi:MAG: hypothetical protein H7323_12525, partial [Frankiales bacterium]|nr:hypothetical protein [Frankiales bacterium]
QMELVNKFDNALAGVTGDGGSTGVVVNSGNRQTTGHYWVMQACPDEKAHSHEPTGDQHDKTQLNIGDEAPEGVDALAGRILAMFGPTRGFVAPAYVPGPHCNTRGLTALGKHLITAMVDKGMIVDPDHMSAAAQRSALDLLQTTVAPRERARAAKAKQPARRPALISSHSWGNDVIYQRIYALDGVVAPRTANATTFSDSWAQHKAWAAANAPKGYDFGLGYGADTNGLGGQPGPRSKPRTKLAYPQAGWRAPIGGVTLRQQRSGLKSFDINRDGVAQYGMFADWYQELQLAADEKHAAQGGGKAILADMLNGAETYLSMWERGVYGANDCVRDGSMPQLEDLHAALGLNVEGFLTAIGQPSSRDGSAYRYCAQGKDGEPTVVDVQFDTAGTASGVRPAVDASVHAAGVTAPAIVGPATGG